MKYTDFTKIVFLALLSTPAYLFAATDGPYVFYRNGKTIVKYVTPQGLIVEEYDATDSVTLRCGSQKNPFTLTLGKDLTPPELSYPLPEEMLILSDIEGNYDALVELLQYEGVIDQNLEWTFGNGHVVHVGDVFDRGVQVNECLWFIYKLEEEAHQAGGAFHYIVGNHDYMNMIGDNRYVDNSYITNTTLLDEANYRDLYASDTEIGQWVRSKNAIEQIGSYTFVHGGVGPHMVAANLSLEEINNTVRLAMDSTYSPNRAIVTEKYGVFWYRGYFKDYNASDGSYSRATSQEIDEILNYLESNRVFVGHTLQDDITLEYGGRVVAVDIKHEDTYYYGYVKALKYEQGSAYAVDTRGYKELLFTDEIVTPIETPRLIHQNKEFNIKGNTLTFLEPTRMQTKVQIFSVNGKQLWEQLIAPEANVIHLPNENLAKGIHIVNISNQHGVHTLLYSPAQ